MRLIYSFQYSIPKYIQLHVIDSNVKMYVNGLASCQNNFSFLWSISSHHNAVQSCISEIIFRTA